MHGSLVVMLLAVLILGLVGGKALGGSGDPGSSGASPVHYRIPPEFIVTRENMDKIDVVSSHGRTDASSQGQPGSPTPSATSLQLALRCAYLCLIFSPAIATSGLAMISVLFRTHVWFWILSRSIAISGAAFIKWGQWASTRPDIFPPELCRALAELQASAPEHSLAFTRQAIERELGLPLERVFESFSERPIASGSIAQVYRARLNGQDVAVKVRAAFPVVAHSPFQSISPRSHTSHQPLTFNQHLCHLLLPTPLLFQVRHPHVREHIEMDFVLMKALARWIEALPGFGWLTLSDSMAQFSVTIASQVALDAEGKHLYVFNRNFRSMPDVRFPKTVFFTGILALTISSLSSPFSLIHLNLHLIIYILLLHYNQPRLTSRASHLPRVDDRQRAGGDVREGRERGQVHRRRHRQGAAAAGGGGGGAHGLIFLLRLCGHCRVHPQHPQQRVPGGDPLSLALHRDKGGGRISQGTYTSRPALRPASAMPTHDTMLHSVRTY